MSDHLIGLIIGGFFVAIWVRFFGNIFALRSFKRNVNQCLRQNRPTMELVAGTSDALTIREKGAMYAINWVDLRKLVQSRGDLGQAIDYWLTQSPPQAVAESTTRDPISQPAEQGKPIDEVSLDRVEKETPQLSAIHCEKCKRVLLKVYYEVNGKVQCETCVEMRKRELAARTPTKRFVRATLWGSGVGLICTFVYYGISALTGFEFGLIAIIVGLAVGLAVRHGSDEQGGWVYQALAIFLTYTSIALTYSPAIVKELVDLAKRQSPASVQATATTQSPPAKMVGPSTAQSGAGATSEPPNPVNKMQSQVKSGEKSPLVTNKTESSKPNASARDLTKTSPTAAKSPTSTQPMTVGQFFLGVTVILAVFWLAPFLAGLRNIMGLLIIGFAVYEAWKINKKGATTIRGPYTVQSQPTSQSTSS